MYFLIEVYTAKNAKIYFSWIFDFDIVFNEQLVRLKIHIFQK